MTKDSTWTLAINGQIEDPVLSHDRFLVIFRFFKVYCHNNDGNELRVENGSEDEVEKAKKERLKKSIMCFAIMVEK